MEIFRAYGIKTEVISASIRNARQVRESALVGADIATLPLGVIRYFISHHKTREGIKLFTDDIVFDYVKLTDKP